MTQFDAPSPSIRRAPGNNIYSLLVFIAFVALTVAVGFVWHKNVQLTSPDGNFSFGANPFTIVAPPQS